MKLTHAFGCVWYDSGWHWECVNCKARSETRGHDFYSRASKQLAEHVENYHRGLLKERTRRRK